MQEQKKPSVLIDFAKLKNLNCGLGRFSLNIGRAILGINRGRMRLFFFLPGNRRGLFPDKDVSFEYVRPWKKYFRFLIGSHNIWHSTNQDIEYLPFDRNVPVILTIHDLNFLREKSDHKIGQRLRRIQKMVDRARTITAVSDFTASEVRSCLDLKGKEVHVIHNGINIEKYPDTRHPDFLPEGKFLFALGVIRSKKNFHVLIDFLVRLKEYYLIIAGNRRSSYARKIKKKAIERGVHNRVFLPGEISDRTRQWLYENCEAVMFPSIAEGFGLPVLEAMSFGKPVFMSRSTSLFEVGGDLGFYWDSFDPDQMVQVFLKGMETYSKDSMYPQKLMLHANRFSWEKAARSYYSIYMRVLEHEV